MYDTTILLLRIAHSISLSATADATVRREYNSLGEMLSHSDNFDGEVKVRPQGSFNLGTAIKPLNGCDDDFDVDLVAIVPDKKTAKETKQSVGTVLEQSTRYSEKLEPEKKRAWTITYSNSHVDVVPAIEYKDSDILVTNKDKRNHYTYLASSPFNFKKWFDDKSADILQQTNNLKSAVLDANVEQPEKFSERTILQQIVQLLKFHRNKMFVDRDSELKPISMILTVLAGEAYQQESDLTVGLQNVANNLRKQIQTDSRGNHIFNPVDHSEDFADKWREYPKRERAFYEWLLQVEEDFGNLSGITLEEFNKKMETIFGESRTNAAFDYLGEQRARQQKSDSVLNSINRTSREVSKHTFWGD